ncbi:transporter substrate-binding domain-containing protein [Balneatrix alpica]|uniref:Transporter substrate-binding domain-containing protein n=1 Tax=Balneatrix alpica TaxID=75684 RepID=A0ABV5ZH23_9GAMM|nr:transporter substrate-binding domain-containing protein [Balneatrix alpica]
MKKLLAAAALTVVSWLGLAGAVSANDNALWEKSTLNQILQRGELRVGLDVGYMPFEMKNKNGDIIGFDVDIAKAMAKAMGVKLTIVNTAWDGIIPALLTDKFDIIMGGMTITAERNLQVNFADPYLVIGQSLVVRKDLEGKVKTYKDLNSGDFKVTAKLGTTGQLAAERYLNKAEIRLFETESDAALEVVNGNADAFVYDLPFNAIYVQQNKGSVFHLGEPFTYEPLGFAIRKGDPDFMNFINNFMRQIKGDGTYDRFYEKWFESDAWLNQVQ